VRPVAVYEIRNLIRRRYRSLHNMLELAVLYLYAVSYVALMSVDALYADSYINPIDWLPGLLGGPV
jgi:hypothetical protein